MRFLAQSDVTFRGRNSPYISTYVDSITVAPHHIAKSPLPPGTIFPHPVKEDAVVVECLLVAVAVQDGSCFPFNIRATDDGQQAVALVLAKSDGFEFVGNGCRRRGPSIIEAPPFPLRSVNRLLVGALLLSFALLLWGLA